MAEQQHAGSVTSPPTSPSKPVSEAEKPESEEKKGPAKKARRVIGQYEYIGQDDRRFLFQDRATKKCFTVDKSLLEYRGEGGFRVEVIESLQK